MEFSSAGNFFKKKRLIYNLSVKISVKVKKQFKAVRYEAIKNSKTSHEQGNCFP